MKIPSGLLDAAPAAPTPRHVVPAISLLLIEDDLDVAAVLEAILEIEDGLSVRQAGSVAEGMREFAARPADLILLDLGLPDSEGLDTLDAVLARAPGTPVIVVTGAGDNAMGMEAIRRGAQDYLIKSEIGGRALVRALRYALDRHALEAEIAQQAREAARRRAQIEDELKLVRSIQQSHLPRQRMTFPPAARPEEAALRFCARYIAAETKGSDFFSVQALSESEVGVLICDVMGHDVSAALVSATVRSLIEERKGDAADPARFLAAINRALHAILHRAGNPIFVTAFYMVADLRRGEVRFANAGHPAPFLIRPCTRRVRSLRTPQRGAALGLFADTQYAVARTRLRAGDLVMLFTDGLYEIESPFAEPYGRERLPNDLRKRIKLPPPRLFDELIEHIRAFSLSRRFEDDVCLVGMEVGGAVVDGE
jgi:serine phosphatase RsbU (regulator of sigma subunit)